MRAAVWEPCFRPKTTFAQSFLFDLFDWLSNYMNDSFVVILEPIKTFLNIYSAVYELFDVILNEKTIDYISLN